MSRYRTPLRYPGGKQRLAPFIAELLRENGDLGGHYAEPYAGGAGVAWELLLSNQVSHVHLNDSSFHLYAFWRSAIYNTDEFCRRISTASLTIEEWKKQREINRNPSGYEEMEVGFSTFYLNRCNRSGVIGGGVIGGLAQTGKWKLDARFSRNELIRRIEAIASKRNAITLSNLDAEKYILEYLPGLPANTFVYCDPPYYHNSRRLYLNQYVKEDHERLAEVIQECLLQHWVVSYDAVAEIRQLYSQRRSFVYDLQYNASRVYKGKEIFIFSDQVQVPNSSSLRCIDHTIRELAIPG